MDNNELNARRRGFMAAIGILIKNADDTTKTEILAILNSIGSDLDLQIQDDTNIAVASDAAVIPCGKGSHWDFQLMMCVPD
jgi:hypothetical protein